MVKHKDPATRWDHHDLMHMCACAPVGSCVFGDVGKQNRPMWASGAQRETHRERDREKKTQKVIEIRPIRSTEQERYQDREKEMKEKLERKNQRRNKEKERNRNRLARKRLDKG